MKNRRFLAGTKVLDDVKNEVEAQLERLPRKEMAQTWMLAEELGGRELVDLIRLDTHTCYLGDHEHVHEWGYGCGTCPACQLRAKGWERYCDR